jgi:hypothetical protein
MWIQSVVVFVVVACCAVVVARTLWRKVANTSAGGCGGCGGCDKTNLASPKGCSFSAASSVNRKPPA